MPSSLPGPQSTTAADEFSSWTISEENRRAGAWAHRGRPVLRARGLVASLPHPSMAPPNRGRSCVDFVVRGRC